MVGEPKPPLRDRFVSDVYQPGGTAPSMSDDAVLQASTSTAQTNLASGGRRWNFTIMSYNILADELVTFDS